MTRTATLPRLLPGVSELSTTAAGLTLKVVWPILDDSMFDREAMAEAQKQWPGFVVRHNVRVAGPPLMHVTELDDYQRAAFGTGRAVVCVASVVKRPPQIGDET